MTRRYNNKDTWASWTRPDTRTTAVASRDLEGMRASMRGALDDLTASFNKPNPSSDIGRNLFPNTPSSLSEPSGSSIARYWISRQYELGGDFVEEAPGDWDF